MTTKNFGIHLWCEYSNPRPYISGGWGVICEPRGESPTKHPIYLNNPTSQAKPSLTHFAIFLCLKHFPGSSLSLSLSLILYFIVTTFDVMPVWLLIISWIYRWKSSFLHSLVPMFWDPTTLKTVTLTECRYMSFFFSASFYLSKFLGDELGLAVRHLVQSHLPIIEKWNSHSQAQKFWS